MEIRQRTDEQPAVEDFDCVKSFERILFDVLIGMYVYYIITMCTYLYNIIIVIGKINTKRVGTFQVPTVSIRLK